MTIWYRTGTVTVTNGSKNVVGVDTTFNTSIYPGDLFTVDENVFYEVADVTSNLNFTLQRNYAGTTGSGEAYVVVPLSPKRQLTAELAARVNILIERYRGAIEAWTAGGWAVDTNGDYKVSGDTDRKLVPIVNGGGGVGSATRQWGSIHTNALTVAGQATTPKTTPTANAVPVADASGKLDTWVTTASDTVKGLVELATKAEAETATDATRAVTPADLADHYRKGNILGTVSQTSGVPTGAVIERGSNANGEYVRFADGTQISTLISTISSIGSPIGTNIIGLSHYIFNITAPVTFIGKSVMSGTVSDGSAYGWISGEPASIESTSVYQVVMFSYSGAVSGAFLNINIIGRWF